MQGPVRVEHQQHRCMGLHAADQDCHCLDSTSMPTRWQTAELQRGIPMTCLLRSLLGSSQHLGTAARRDSRWGIATPCDRASKAGPRQDLQLQARTVRTYDGVDDAGQGDEHQQGTKGHSNCCGLVLGLQAPRACNVGVGVRVGGLVRRLCQGAGCASYDRAQHRNLGVTMLQLLCGMGNGNLDGPTVCRS